MLMLPHIIDKLMGKSHEAFINYAPPEDTAKIIELLLFAEKFDFGDLHLERGDKKQLDGSYDWRAPELTDEERGFFREKLVPLPANPSWYEFVLGGHRSGLLVLEKDDIWHVLRIDAGFLDGIWISQDINPLSSSFGKYMCEGNKGLLTGKKFQALAENMSYASNFLLAQYFTLMINSKSTEIVREDAPAKLNKARQSRGKAPLPAHRVVTIVPKKYIRRTTGEGEHEKRCSPRLHWRRSHKRELSSGKVIIIARMLVGKSELGEVTHEYRVK